ncbi:MAG: hypothetical protein QGG48_10595, partial [Desulfatiglandales bacterium]|nr:hypothetical protein [Desulfatiglandales bacterium]
MLYELKRGDGVADFAKAALATTVTPLLQKEINKTSLIPFIGYAETTCIIKPISYNYFDLYNICKVPAIME